MKMLRIAADLSLPLETVTQTIAILAKRRAGKSYTMRRLVEQLFKAGQQIVLVDPKGDQHGLRSAANGKDPGLPIVILGGERGDVPLEPSSGEVVAKLVVEERVSALLDLSSFRKHEVATFMTAFMENLYRLKAREIYRTPMMLVIDEADAIAPQKPQKGEERMLGAAEDIVRRGGQRGIGCVLVTQRSAVLNKNVLTQAQVLIVLRTIAPQDLAAMKAWIDVHGDDEQGRTLMDSLPSLPVGDAWFWSPGWPTVEGIFKRVHVLPIETFDSGKSPDPNEKERAEPKSLAEVDLDALKGQMAATIEKAKADDPRELRKQIADLKRELEGSKKIPTGSIEIQEKRVEVLTEGDRKTLERVHKQLVAVTVSLPQMAKEILDRAQIQAAQLFEVRQKVFIATLESKGFQKVLTKLAALTPEEDTRIAEINRRYDREFVERSPNPVRQGPAKAPRVTAPAGSNPALSATLDGPSQRVLNVLAELEILGVQRPERVQVALLAGYTNLNSKGLTNALGGLRTAGFIDYPQSGTVELTSTGRQHAAYPEVPRSSREIQDRVVRLLGGSSARLLEPLLKAYPGSMRREDLATVASYTNLNSKGFTNAIGRLRSLGFIDYPTRGEVVAQSVLFLNGGR